MLIKSVVRWRHSFPCGRSWVEMIVYSFSEQTHARGLDCFYQDVMQLGRAVEGWLELRTGDFLVSLPSGSFRHTAKSKFKVAV